MNAQFAVQDGVVYVLEVNPRASRTVPFVSKATGVPLAKVAARMMIGRTLAELGITETTIKHVAVKESVFPFVKFPGVDTLLGPEMRSTGEVMGIDRDFPAAFAKAQQGAGNALPSGGKAFLSVAEHDKPGLVPVARKLAALGFGLIATRGTATLLRQAGLEVTDVNKVAEGRPHSVDALENGDITLVVNTTGGGRQEIQDSYSLRRTALMRGIAYFTTLRGAQAAAEGIGAFREIKLTVRPLQDYASSPAVRR
jgi:carbamoyl-phosphate synthase large subunit